MQHTEQSLDPSRESGPTEGFRQSVVTKLRASGENSPNLRITHGEREWSCSELAADIERGTDPDANEMLNLFWADRDEWFSGNNL